MRVDNRAVMKPFQLLALFFALGCAQAPAQDNAGSNQAASPPAPSASNAAEQEAIMDRIERDIRLPDGAGPLAAYARSYAWQQRGDGVRKVVAVYENLTGAPAGRRRWVAETDLPLVLDGGCGLISLSYDVATQRIEHVTCNGEA
jgi:hypothetical protein